MKTICSTLFALITLTSFTQQTFVPDDNFESYLEANSMGNGIPNDDYVLTSNISSVDTLHVGSMGIQDLTGIEDFTSLVKLSCSYNWIQSLDVSQNTALEYLYISDLYLTSLDLSQNIVLTQLICNGNQLTTLDVSQNTSLNMMVCWNNPLECLNVKNGNNSNITVFQAMLCPTLTCIEVDDAAWSTANWTGIDTQTSFSTDCLNTCSLNMNELNSIPKQLLKIMDITGREITDQPNKLLFKIYNDGSVEKVFRVE